MPEKRRAERVRVNIRAIYKSETVSLEGRVSDLSRSGLFFRSDFLDDAGTRADVVIEIPAIGRRIALESYSRAITALCRESSSLSVVESQTTLPQHLTMDPVWFHLSAAPEVRA